MEGTTKLMDNVGMDRHFLVQSIESQSEHVNRMNGIRKGKTATDWKIQSN